MKNTNIEEIYRRSWFEVWLRKKNAADPVNFTDINPAAYELGAFVPLHEFGDERSTKRESWFDVWHYYRQEGSLIARPPQHFDVMVLCSSLTSAVTGVMFTPVQPRFFKRFLRVTDRSPPTFVNNDKDDQTYYFTIMEPLASLRKMASA